VTPLLAAKWHKTDATTRRRRGKAEEEEASEILISQVFSSFFFCPSQTKAKQAEKKKKGEGQSLLSIRNLFAEINAAESGMPKRERKSERSRREKPALLRSLCNAPIHTHMHTMHIRKPSQRNAAGPSKSTFDFTNSHFNNLQSK